jgi:lipopolysaccharide/colanic/teichoic acid biosynthesis glycosyltransferase
MSHDLILNAELGVRRTSGSSRAVRYFLKQMVDCALGGLALMLLAPLLLVIATMIRRHDGGPAFYRQTRIGREGRPFRCLKFRSMIVNSDTVLKQHLAADAGAAAEWRATQKLAADPRITPLGAFLRKTSLDELPQLINIARGEMSFVGPRPIVPDEIHRYGEHFSHCFSVTPGLTGLWQVSGRSDCSYAMRVALDTRYVDEWQFSTDVQILLRTVPAVLRQQGSR